MSSLKTESQEKHKRMLKYILFAFIIALSLRYIPTNNINNTEILIISMIGSITFGIVDMLSPSIYVKTEGN